MHSQLRASICVAVAEVLRHGADPQQREALDLYAQALQLYHESAGAGAIEMGAAYLGIGHIWGSRGEQEASLKYYVAAEAVARTHLAKQTLTCASDYGRVAKWDAGAEFRGYSTPQGW